MTDLHLKGVTCLQELEILKNFAISKSFGRKWGATAKYSKSTPQLFTFPFFFFCFLNHCSQHWVLFLMASFSFTLEWFCSVDLSGVESLPRSVSFSHCFQAHFFSEFELGVYSQFPMVPGTYFFLAHKEDFLSLAVYVMPVLASANTMSASGLQKMKDKSMISTQLHGFNLGPFTLFLFHFSASVIKAFWVAQQRGSSRHSYST